ncbi:hypothetical protein AZE42_04656 [Rhizopogon vesiculosus]|uniref:Uncharacterized protein n=1 Tax=Rhizopogon vesiculosus TaxID=180088 RepID=A0A1J8PR10_9AGAM|nr:hypothetical protein AZE42_04656 [Rhizopogon vesiculosus]
MVPPISRMFITSAWLESILYGMHPLESTACFLAHAFTNPSIISVSDGSSLYLVRHTTLFLAAGTLHLLNVFALNLLLIWRLYVVWCSYWILIVMLTLEATHIATSVTGWVLLFRTSSVFSQRSHDFVDVGLSFDLVVTITVTSGLSYRLWRAGRRVSDLTGGQNAYKAVIYTIIESGAIYTSSIIVVSGLLMSGSVAGAMAVNVTVQIATLAPLLLIARLGLGLTYGESKQSKTLSVAEPSFVKPIEVNITEEISTYPMDAVDSSSRLTQRSISPYHDSGAEKNVQAR